MDALDALDALFATVAGEALLATVAAVLFGQLRRITGSRFRFEQAVVAGSIVVPVLLLVTGQDSALWSGLALGAGYIAYMRVMRSRQEVSGPSQSESAQKPWSGRRSHIVVQVLIVIAGLVGLYFLGDVLGDSVCTNSAFPSPFPPSSSVL